jgi:hypothetical protein
MDKHKSIKKLRIKTYEEKFVEEQARLGTNITEKWSLYWQSNVEQLRMLYSDSSFDPTTRFYAFSGNVR